MKTYKIRIYWPHDSTEQYIIKGTLHVYTGSNCYFLIDENQKEHYYPIIYTKIDEE